MRISLFLFFVVIIAGCNEQQDKTVKNEHRSKTSKLKTEKELILDSLDAVYLNLGFEGYCDALKEDEVLYITAAAIAEKKFPSNDTERTKLELSTYNNFYRDWLSAKKIDQKQFEEDKLKDVFVLNNQCALENKYVLSGLRFKIKELVSTTNNVTYASLGEHMKNNFRDQRERSTSTVSNRETNPASVSESDITKWMSSWDGSIFELEYAVKKLLNDPDSFEHVETSGSTKNGAKVKMVFRAKNKLGNLVTNTAYADLNTEDGTVSNVRVQ